MFALVATSAMAQFQVSVYPQVGFPVGESNRLFATEFGVDMGVQFAPPALAPLGFTLRTSGLIIPLEVSGNILLAGVSAGVQALVPFSEQFFGIADASLGYHFDFPAEWESAVPYGSGFLMQARLGVGMRVTPFMDFIAGGGFDYAGGLQLAARAHAGINIRIGNPESLSGVQIDPNTPIMLLESDRGLSSTDLSLNPLFPALYGQYDHRPVGTITLTNNEDTPAEEIRVSVFVEEAMANPYVTELHQPLAAGESTEVTLNALFTDDVMAFSEGSRLSGEVRIDYRLDGQAYARELTPVFEFLNRNALVWDDDARICSFVTSKDPVIIAIARSAAALVGRESLDAVDENFRKAMLIFTILGGHQLAYQVDPVTPYEDLSGDTQTIDFLQFPRQTLQYGTGDCDDLAALYAALLEAIGIHTAFVTHPGHIYLAFELSRPLRAQQGMFSNPDDLIVDGESVWVPVEVTMLGDDFLRAWRTAASQWRRYSAAGTASLHDTREGWTRYPAVGFFDNLDAQTGGAAGDISLLGPDDYDTYRELLNTYISQEIYPRVVELEDRIGESREPSRLYNRLGVLYGQYGMEDEAESAFRFSLTSRINVSALINLGHIAFLREDWVEAQEYYEQASDVDPENPLVMLSLARVSHELENYGTTRRMLDRVAAVDPDLADAYPYLRMTGDDASRAADAQGALSSVLWSLDDEEE